MTAIRAQRGSPSPPAPAAGAGLLASAAMPDRARRLDPDGLLDPFRRDPAGSAVLCDVDGTLAPIVARPEDAALLPGLREALRDLRPRVALLGFVSGRAPADARRMVGLEECAYAGNHGAEFLLPGRSEPEVAEQARPSIEAVRAFVAAHPPALLDPHGVRLEDKGVTLTLHFRTAPDPEAAEAFLDREIGPAAEALGLRVTKGRMIREVRPAARVDKGTAVRTLLAGAGARRALYLGDDTTDLDAWAALRAMAGAGDLERALAVGVLSAGVPERVVHEADLLVDGPAGALAVLRLLAGAPAA